MSDAQELLAEVVRRHELGGVREDRFIGRLLDVCSCGVESRFNDHPEHVAAEIDKALGLTEFTVNDPVPERWWATSIQYLDDNSGWRWPDDQH